MIGVDTYFLSGISSLATSENLIEAYENIKEKNHKTNLDEVVEKTRTAIANLKDNDVKKGVVDWKNGLKSMEKNIKQLAESERFFGSRILDFIMPKRDDAIAFYKNVEAERKKIHDSLLELEGKEFKCDMDLILIDRKEEAINNALNNTQFEVISAQLICEVGQKDKFDEKLERFKNTNTYKQIKFKFPSDEHLIVAILLAAHNSKRGVIAKDFDFGKFLELINSEKDDAYRSIKHVVAEIKRAAGSSNPKLIIKME